MRNNHGEQKGADRYVAPCIVFTVDEAARRLKISRSTLFGLINKGDVRSVRLGPRGVRIPAAEIERLISLED